MTSKTDHKVRANIKFCVNLGFTPTQALEKLREAKHTSCRSLVFKWHDRYRKGRESLEDDVRSGRPKKISTSIQEKITALLDDDRRLTVREISENVDSSLNTVHRVIADELNMSKVSARWVPRLLTYDDKPRRLSAFQEFVKRYRKEGENFLNRISTTDETRLWHYDPETKAQSTIWKTVTEPQAKKVRVSRYGGKHMFIFFMDRAGMILQHRVPEGKTVNADYYSKSSVGGRNYIASQGPSERTLNDFWRMVWEESIGVIVILTNCFELGKVKCVQYWPDTDALTFGDLEVTLLSQKVYNEYTIRCLHCKKVGQDSGHDVMQFHFTAWPDKQVPETALSLVNFWRQVRTSDTDGLLRWLVHCSAGIGRTGTFIALDALYEKGRRNNKFNVYDYVTELRHQRQMMVQTAEQYIFLHLAVAEALVPLGTLCTAEAFPEQLAGLTASGQGQASQLRIEYEAVKSMTEEDSPDTEYGNLPIGMDLQRCAQSFLKENRDKSRDGQTHLVSDEYRPRLGCHVDNRNDHINAVNMPTYGLGGGLILTQVPLPNTVVDFLRLVFTYNVKFVVLLESSVPQDCQFWPRAGYSTTFGPFTVIHVGESIHQYHTCWDLECLYKDRSIDVTVLQYTGSWQNDVMCPDEHESFLEIVSAVDSTNDPSVLSKPIVVQCMDGNEKSGLFAALYTIIERIKCTGDVSIAETVLRIRGRRRQAICSVEQYQFLHNATRNYIDSLQVYANI